MKTLIALAATAVALSAASLTVSITHAGPQGMTGVAGVRGPQGPAGPAAKTVDLSGLGVCVDNQTNTNMGFTWSDVDVVTQASVSPSGTRYCNSGTYVSVQPFKGQ